MQVVQVRRHELFAYYWVCGSVKCQRYSFCHYAKPQVEDCIWLLVLNILKFKH